MKKYYEFIKENKDGSWTYEGNFTVTEEMVNNGMLIKSEIPDIIHGDFICGKLGLTSLKNCPKEVTGTFNCSENELTSLEFGPEKAHVYICIENKLTNLKGCPEVLKGDLLCNYNKLTDLTNGPKEVRAFYNCAHNEITSLKGAPDKFYNNFYCSFNKLTSLEYCPEILNGFIIHNDNVFDLDIEYSFILNGYTNYWTDLLRYCIDENIELDKVKGWPEGFLTDNTVKSAKGISKFDL